MLLMSDLALIENNNNLQIENFDLVIATGSLYVANKIRIRLSTFQNEWFLNINAGLPYYQDILIKNPNLDLIADLFQTEILNTTGVDSLEEFNLDLNGRTLQITFICVLDSGELLELSQEVII